MRYGRAEPDPYALFLEALARLAERSEPVSRERGAKWGSFVASFLRGMETRRL